MAQRIVTQLVDDTTGEEIQPGDGETITFAIDGQNYSLDLTRENAEAFRSLFSDYIAVAAKTSSPRRSTSKKRQPAGHTAELRTWARANGWPDLGDRGRVPADAQAAYERR